MSLPTHLGRQVDEETGYNLTCSATPSGDPNVAALCGKPAKWHVRWGEASTENGLACQEHLAMALAFDPFQVHSVEGSACQMPGSFWITEAPSHCTMLAMDVDPDRSGHHAMQWTR